MPPRQTLPHAPQLVVLVFRSTQVPLQQAGFDPSVQALPQAPQLALLV